MAQWKVQSDEEAETGGGGSRFTPAPRGVYTIQVANVKDGYTQITRRPKVDLECEIADQGPEFGKKVWMTVTNIPKGEKGHGFLVRSLHAFGFEGDVMDFDTGDFQARQARALLGVEDYEKVVDGRTYKNQRNVVEELYTKNHPEPKELPEPRQRTNTKPTPAPAAVDAKNHVEMDSIPF